MAAAVSRNSASTNAPDLAVSTGSEIRPIPMKALHRVPVEYLVDPARLH